MSAWVQQKMCAPQMGKRSNLQLGGFSRCYLYTSNLCLLFAPNSHRNECRLSSIVCRRVARIAINVSGRSTGTWHATDSPADKICYFKEVINCALWLRKLLFDWSSVGLADNLIGFGWSFSKPTFGFCLWISETSCGRNNISHYIYTFNR